MSKPHVTWAVMERVYVLSVLVVGVLGYVIGTVVHNRTHGHHVPVAPDTVELVRLESVFTADTIRLRTVLTRWDTVRQTEVVVRHDTAWVPLAVAEEAVDACLGALGSCTALVEEERRLREYWEEEATRPLPEPKRSWRDLFAAMSLGVLLTLLLL